MQLFFSHKRRVCYGAFALVLMSACSTGQPGQQINDPHEQANRQVHAFNKGLDRNVLRPAGQVAAAAPEEITVMVSNFADNVGLPSAIANGILQADIDGAATNTMRFLINSTAGIGGLFNPAGVIGLNEEETDFGETLAVWGVGEGAYVELPVLGPSTQRDAVGTVVDFIIDPLDNVGLTVQSDFDVTARTADLAITRGRFMDTVDGILYDSADSYSQARLAYLQNRRFQLGEEAPAIEEIDPFSGDLSLEGFE